MKTVIKRLEDLRQAMRNHGCDIYIMPSSDPHSSEYAPAHYTAWEYFSGFACENATMIVSESYAGLWVDGRFFGAADSALKGTGIESVHMGVKGVPTVMEWLDKNLSEGQVLGYDAKTMPLKDMRKLEKICYDKNADLSDLALPDEAWTEDRPALPSEKAWILGREYTGKDTKEKLYEVRQALKKENCTSMLITELDCTAWLLNLRGADVEDTPYALAFCFLASDKAVLFTDEKRIEAEAKKILSSAGVIIKPYDAVPTYIKSINSEETVLTDPSTVNSSLYNALKDNKNIIIKEGTNPIAMMKAVKNDTELSCSKKAHLFDGACMVRFQMELEKRLEAGEKLRETDIDKILHKFRSSSDKFITESFTTIAAWGANAAMMHYFPVEGSDSEIKPESFLLVDSGATYLDGTTDITRTYTLGKLKDSDRTAYTRVLKCHIDLAMAVWKEGATGGELDMLARQPLWKYMLDYRCGTGHSVSHVGAVHEGPHSLRPHNSVKFVPGMVITDEPGIYEEGNIGIRIENELYCTEAGESGYGKFLKFTPLTYVPIDLTAVNTDDLTADEKQWLNDYHSKTYEKISPLLNDEEKAWLKNKCRAI